MLYHKKNSPKKKKADMLKMYCESNFFQAVAKPSGFKS